MANFKIADALTARNEGGLANNPKDKGKLTYAGIASKYWPAWKGWPIVLAAIEKHQGIIKKANAELIKNVQLSFLVTGFYMANFWNSLSLSLVKDQQIANTVYDFAVNSGTENAAEKLQETINELLPRQAFKLVVDGAIGPKTISALNGLVGFRVYNLFNEKREHYYRSLDDFDTWGASWLSRLKKYKTSA